MSASWVERTIASTRIPGVWPRNDNRTCHRQLPTVKPRSTDSAPIKVCLFLIPKQPKDELCSFVGNKTEMSQAWRTRASQCGGMRGALPRWWEVQSPFQSTSRLHRGAGLGLHLRWLTEPVTQGWAEKMQEAVLPGGREVTPTLLTLSSLKKEAPEGRFPWPTEVSGRYPLHQQTLPAPHPNPSLRQETNVNGKHLKWKGSLFLLNCLWLHKILRSD